MSDAKYFFKRIEIYNAIIESKMDEIAHLESMITRITPVLSDSPGCGGSDSQRKVDDAVVKIVDLKDRLKEMIDYYVSIKNNALSVMDHLDSAIQYRIIYKRYFESKSWQVIADEMDMSIRNVCYLHGKALQNMELFVDGENI